MYLNVYTSFIRSDSGNRGCEVGPDLGKEVSPEHTFTHTFTPIDN